MLIKLVFAALVALGLMSAPQSQSVENDLMPPQCSPNCQ